MIHNNNKDDNKKEEEIIDTEFSFGHRFYYWEYYKNAAWKDELNSDGLRYCDLYVVPKYASLKEELLSQENGTSINLYNSTINK